MTQGRLQKSLLLTFTTVTWLPVISLRDNALFTEIFIKNHRKKKPPRLILQQECTEKPIKTRKSFFIFNYGTKKANSLLT